MLKRMICLWTCQRQLSIMNVRYLNENKSIKSPLVCLIACGRSYLLRVIARKESTAQSQQHSGAEGTSPPLGPHKKEANIVCGRMKATTVTTVSTESELRYKRVANGHVSQQKSPTFRQWPSARLDLWSIRMSIHLLPSHRELSLPLLQGTSMH